MIRLLGVGALILAILFGHAAVEREKVDFTCGGSVSTPTVVKLLDGSGKVGDAFADLIDDGPTPFEVVRFVYRTLDMLAMTVDNFRRHLNREPEASYATGWRNKAQQEQQKALASCCVQNTTPVQPPAGDPPADPFDPKSASLQSSSGSSPEQVARAAAARYFPANLVDTMTAIAGAESTWNPNARNASGHSGLWQINAQAAAGQNWRDPVVNARLAFGIYSEIGLSRGWTTYSSGSYKRFLRPGAAAAAPGPGPAPDAGPTAPTAPTGGCTTTGTMTARVGTWNTYVHNSEANVVAGARAMAAAGADVIALQELPTEQRRNAVGAALPGYRVAGMNTSTPVYVRTAKFTITRDVGRVLIPRHQAFEGPVQGARFLTEVELQDTTTNAVSTVLNTHMLPRVQKNGKLNTAWPQRIGWFRRQLTATVAAANLAKQRGPVAVVGDFNFDGDPDGAFGKAGLASASDVLGKADSRKGRDIDQVRSTGTTATAQQTLGAFGSDHHPKIVDLSTPAASAADAAVGGPSPAGFNMPGNRTVDQAIGYMSSAASSGKRIRVGTCLHEVAVAYGHNSTQRVNGHYYATGQWDAMPAQYRHTTGSPPRGALVFWQTSGAAGHIAISNGDGTVWTTDPPGASGTIGNVPISKIDTWGKRLGWSEPFFVGRTGVRA